MIARNEEGQLAEATFSVLILTERANELHHKVGPACRSALRYAKECGDVLISLRKEFPLHGRMWKLHIEEHFDAPYEAAKVYMRIARKWDDRRLVQTPRHGLVLKSVKQVLNISKNGPDPESEQSSDKPAPAVTRQDIRQGFTKALQQLSSYELELFATEFNYYWVKIRKMLYRDTSRVLGQDLDEFLLAELNNAKDSGSEDGWQAQEPPPKDREEKEHLRFGFQDPEHDEGEVREKSPQSRCRKMKRTVRRFRQEAAVDAAKRKRALETANQRKKIAKRRAKLRTRTTEITRRKKASTPKKGKKKVAGRKVVTKRKTSSTGNKAKKKTDTRKKAKKTTNASRKAKKKTAARRKVAGKKTLKKKPSGGNRTIKKKAKARKKSR